MKKGLKLTDRFHDLVQRKPNRLKQIYDQRTANKIPMVLETVGKPNMLVSVSGIDGNAFAMGTLACMTPDEFVDAAERLSGDAEGGRAYQKIFEQIMKDKRENEYNRTKVSDRRTASRVVKKQAGFEHNVNRSPRIIEAAAGSMYRRPDSYMNKKLRANMTRAAAVSSSMAMRGVNNSLCLEVRGQSQLMKELHECTAMHAGDFEVRSKRKTTVVKDAIHRNEVTKEVEPEGYVDEYLENEIDVPALSKPGA